MPLGKVNSGDFRDGTPMILPHGFGTPVHNPEPFGNVIPQSNPTLNSNPVNWKPTPKHFGNFVDFSLQSVPPIIIISRGGQLSVLIPIANLEGVSESITLSATGAPVGVTVSFFPNPVVT